jgi:hypothetical protein
MPNQEWVPLSNEASSLAPVDAPLVELVAQGWMGLAPRALAKPVGLLALGTLRAELALTSPPRGRLPPKPTRPDGSIALASRFPLTGREDWCGA